VWGRGVEWGLEGSWPDVAAASLFLEHLRVRSFALATVRAYAYDVLCFARFCAERELRLGEVVPADLFDWVAWQADGPAPGRRQCGAADPTCRCGTVIDQPAGGGSAGAVRAPGCAVLGVRAENPVPAPRRGQGLRATSAGCWASSVPAGVAVGAAGASAPAAAGGAGPAEVAAFLADLSTHRDRAITLAMLLGGLRAGEVRALKLTDVDQGLRRLRVCGKSGWSRLTGRSLSSWPHTCASSGRRGWPRPPPGPAQGAV
jgi:hypothetical protein